MEPLKILLVDDEPGTVQLVRRILQADGHQVFEALDGEQAIALFHDSQPDLVLLDIVIPKIDGLGVLEEIRQHDKITGVIMVSALTSEQLAVRSMQGGADDYVSKPFRLKSIRLQIRQVMEKVRLRRQNLTLQTELIAANEKLRHYMAAPLVERVLSSPTPPNLGGEHHEVSVMFVDFCDFTPLAHALPPDEVLSLLNEYFGLLTTSVLENGGYLDKIMGDGFMALFNVPTELTDHATYAVLSAVDMSSKVGQLAMRKNPALNLRVGIHTGGAVVGNIGTATLMNYTAIGDTVNVAKRLEEMGGDGQILISVDTYQRLNLQELDSAGVQIAQVGPRAVKGRRDPVSIYQVACA